MNPSKGPGPDGFTTLFFQKFWHVLWTDITQRIMLMLNSKRLENGVNDTMITLIPKIKQAVSLDDYRPISLCNVVRKIFSKVLANRLKLILHEVISESQSAFIPRWLISDNFLLAQELSHFIKIRRVQK